MLRICSEASWSSNNNHYYNSACLKSPHSRLNKVEAAQTMRGQVTLNSEKLSSWKIFINLFLFSLFYCNVIIITTTLDLTEKKLGIYTCYVIQVWIDSDSS